MLDAFGVSGTVTLEGEVPADVTVVWLPPTTEDLPVGAEFDRAGLIRVLAVSRDEVPQLPVGALVVAPEFADGPLKAWRVDGYVRGDSEHHRVTVVLDASATADLPDTE